MITKKEIEKVAKLSKLEFSEKELEQFIPEFNKILEYVNSIASVDTSSLKNEVVAINAETELRADEPHTSFTQEQATKNAEEKRDGMFAVPAVLEEA